MDFVAVIIIVKLVLFMIHNHDDDDDDDDLRGIIEGRSLKAWGCPCSNALTSHSLGLR